MVVTAGSLHLFPGLGVCKNQLHTNQPQNAGGTVRLVFLGGNLSSAALRQSLWSTHISRQIRGRVYTDPYRKKTLRCQSFLGPDHTLDFTCLKNTTTTLSRSYHTLQNNQYVLKLVPAVGIVAFAVWGVGPLLRQSRKLFRRNDGNWKKSSTYYVMTSYIQPLLIWTGAVLLCRTVDPVVLPTEASQAVKTRLINFVRSLSTVIAFAYCLSSVIQHVQKFVMETNEPADPRNLGIQFAGKAVDSAVWFAAAALFMELLGFSTQKWLTAGGLGTVLLTLSGREIITNFLSSAIIHATRPFVLNEWIQTNIEGYEVSGTVERVGWWSPTVIRGEHREAVYIPNNKFTVNVVRNLTQKTHWRIKTHLAISHLDVSKINNIVADMRKVLAKNPQVEQQRLHRRVFLENINPENQALVILISCFVKTSHKEEYLGVKEGILLDLLRVIRHHRARLATPIRTMHKMHSGAEVDNVPFGDSIFGNGTTSNRPLLLIEPPNKKVNGEDKTKTQSRSARQKSEVDSKGGTSAIDPKTKETTVLDNAKDKAAHEVRSDGKVDQSPDVSITEANNDAVKPSSDVKDRQTRKSSSIIQKADLIPDVSITEANNDVLQPSSDVKDGQRTRKSSSNIPKSDLSPDVSITEANNAAVKPSSDVKDSQRARKSSSIIPKADLSPDAASITEANNDAVKPSFDVKDSQWTRKSNSNIRMSDLSPDVSITEANSAAVKPSSDVKDSRGTRKSTSSIPKADLSDVDVSDSDTEVLTSNSNSNATTSKQPKKAVSATSYPGNAADRSVSSSKNPGEKPIPLSSNMQSKSEGVRGSASQSPVSMSSVEENIVLGVALEGSKRTLPMENDTVSPENLSGEKELAMSRGGNGSPISGKDKDEGSESDTPGTTIDDQRKQKD